MRHLRTSMTLVVVTFSQPFCVSPLERRSIVCNDMAQQMGQMTCQDNWPAGTNDYNCYYNCGGQCLGQKLIQSISFQDKCNMNLNWLMVHVSNESTHIHMDHKHTITKWIPHDWNLRLPNIEACTASHTQRSPGTCSARNRQMYTLGLLQRKLDDLPSFHDDFMLRPAPLHEATLNEANCQSLVLVFEHNRSFQDWSSKGICDTCTHPWQN